VKPEYFFDKNLREVPKDRAEWSGYTTLLMKKIRAALQAPQDLIQSSEAAVVKLQSLITES
jgi:hypothetical protein